VKIERQGYDINRSAVKGCVDVFLTLYVSNDGATVYTRDLEPVLLKESREFYEEEGQKSLVECGSPEYLRKVCHGHGFSHPILPNKVTGRRAS
jgi:cullin 3